MPPIEPDTRSAARRALDEQIAEETHSPAPELPADVQTARFEEHLRREARRPLAFPAIVENGVIRLIDRDIALPEPSRVIVVAESA